MMQRATRLPCLSRLRRNLAVAATLFLLVLVTPSLRAQSNQGAILGTVKDPSGAIVSGAKITLLNTDEGVSRETTSGGSGDFQFLEAKAAHYTISVTAEGFENGPRPMLRLPCVSSCGSASFLLSAMCSRRWSSVESRRARLKLRPAPSARCIQVKMRKTCQ